MIDLHTSPPLAQRQAIGAAGLAALMTVARCGGEPSAKALTAIRAVRDHLLRIELDLASLPSLRPAELASRVLAVNPDPQWRERILRGMTLVALLDGEPTPARQQLLDDAAAALAVDAAPVRSFAQVMDGKLNLLRLDIGRRGFVKAAMGATLRQEGLRGALGVARVILGQEDPAMAGRYRALRDYPPGSFGRAYAAFIDRNGFGFPGELGGPPPPVAFGNEIWTSASSTPSIFRIVFLSSSASPAWYRTVSSKVEDINPDFAKSSSKVVPCLLGRPTLFKRDMASTALSSATLIIYWLVGAVPPIPVLGATTFWAATPLEAK